MSFSCFTDVYNVFLGIMDNLTIVIHNASNNIHDVEGYIHDIAQTNITNVKKEATLLGKLDQPALRVLEKMVLTK